MARFIDADALYSRAYDDVHYRASIEDWEFDLLAYYLDSEPTVDAVPVVRCKDCAVPHNKWIGCPKMNGTVMPPDGFCSYGERKDGDE